MQNAPQCRHLKMGGHPCRAFALKGQPFCYQHHRTHRERVEARRSAPGRRRPTPELLFRVASIDDLRVIQQALSVILSGVAEGTLAPRRVNPLIRALAIASRNAGNRLRDRNAEPPPSPAALALLAEMAAAPVR